MKINRKKIVLIGGGGHCKVVIDAISRANCFEIIGVIDKDPKNLHISDIKVIGDDEVLKKVFQSGCIRAFIALGSVGNEIRRIKLDKILKKIGFILPSIVHPLAYIAESVKIDDGVFVAAGAVIQPGSHIGRNAIINTNSSIDHDCKIGNFVHITPGSVISGGVEIGENSHIGTGSSIIEYIKIGKNTIVGAGSNVVSDIPSNCKAYGNPCRVVN